MNKIIDKKIVIDSCALIYACDEETKDSTLEIFIDLAQNNRLTCSSLSAFEVIKNRQRRNNEKEYTSFLNNLHRIPIDSPVLMNASTLYYLYEESGRINKKNNFQKDILDPQDKLTGDLIIGGTVISYENHILLTSNKKDFPEPYWKSIYEYEITKTDNTIIKVYLLEPNMTEILKNISTGLQKPEEWNTRNNLYSYRG